MHASPTFLYVSCATLHGALIIYVRCGAISDELHSRLYLLCARQEHQDVPRWFRLMNVEHRIYGGLEVVHRRLLEVVQLHWVLPPFNRDNNRRVLRI